MNIVMESHDDGWLSRVPGEVRNEVYRYLASGGDLAMMRTSHRISEEMGGLVLEETSYRMFIDYPKEGGAKCRSRVPDGRIGEGIQRVEVHWRLPYNSTTPHHGYWEEEESEESMATFQWDPVVRRKRCVVLLERDSCTTTWFKCQDLLAWRRLAVFEEVVFRVVWKRPRFKRQDRFTVSLLETVGRGVGSTLGVSERGSDDEGEFVRFHPGVSGGGSAMDSWLTAELLEFFLARIFCVFTARGGARMDVYGQVYECLT